MIRKTYKIDESKISDTGVVGKEIITGCSDINLSAPIFKAAVYRKNGFDRPRLEVFRVDPKDKPNIVNKDVYERIGLNEFCKVKAKKISNHHSPGLPNYALKNVEMDVQFKSPPSRVEFSLESGIVCVRLFYRTERNFVSIPYSICNSSLEEFQELLRTCNRIEMSIILPNDENDFPLLNMTFYDKGIDKLD